MHKFRTHETTKKTIYYRNYLLDCLKIMWQCMRLTIRQHQCTCPELRSVPARKQFFIIFLMIYSPQQTHALAWPDTTDNLPSVELRPNNPIWYGYGSTLYQLRWWYQHTLS